MKESPEDDYERKKSTFSVLFWINLRNEESRRGWLIDGMKKKIVYTSFFHIFFFRSFEIRERR